MSRPPEATVVVTTRNRREDLRKTLASVLGQTAAIEVLVVDDASSDGTAEMVRRDFPIVRLHRAERPYGYIVQRNLAARMASTPVIVSVDDDATFSTPNTIAQTLTEFDHPRVGAVAMPFINVGYGDQVLSRAPDDRHRYVTAAYVGTAHAFRRDVFLRLGGYREYLYHYAEESDYCARMLDAGFVTRLGRADRIDHWVSPQRDRSRYYVFATRNRLLFAWHNVPMPYLPIHYAGVLYNSARIAVQDRHPLWVLKGIASGHLACMHEFRQRRPLHARTYRLNRLLLRRGAVPLDAIDATLPPLPDSPVAAAAATGPGDGPPEVMPAAPSN